MRHLPAFLDIAGRSCLVVGGGVVAARKADLLERAGGRVRVNSPELVPSLLRGVAAGRIEHIDGAYDPSAMEGCAVAIAATDDRETNARVSWDARRRGIPVNVVDDPALCSFIVPAIVDRDPVLVAVSTGGTSPVLARWVRRRIERALPAALGSVAKLAERWRAAVRDRVPDIAARRSFWERQLDGTAAGLALAGRDTDADRVLGAALAGPVAVEGVVHLVGAGPGDPELLTLKAHRLLQSADAVVYDRLVSAGVLDLARRDAETIYVGKAPGAQAMRQEEINALLVRLARDGKNVVRLKGGDPFVFGRGGEEMQAVEAAGLTCHVVPGITAATGCATAAGIPLTHRGIAQSCTFITGHGENGEADADWAAIARANQTIAVYMGLAALPRLARRLIGHGLPPSTPAAVIENGTTPRQRIVTGRLGDIADIAAREGFRGPALAIVGEVAALAKHSAPAAEAPTLAAAG